MKIKVLEAIAAYPNICRQLHLPAQSGSTAVLVRVVFLSGGTKQSKANVTLLHVCVCVPQNRISAPMVYILLHQRHSNSIRSVYAVYFEVYIYIQQGITGHDRR